MERMRWSPAFVKAEVTGGMSRGMHHLEETIARRNRFPSLELQSQGAGFRELYPPVGEGENGIRKLLGEAERGTQVGIAAILAP
jgi:hypothetical protein